MPRYWFRSTIFNLLFFVITAIACIICLPTLFMSRQAFLGVVHGWLYFVYTLERIILDLHYEVRGQEHLPQDGSFIVAAKHQSPHETFKLHLLLKDPAIILKKELLKVPLWGKYLQKSDVIAIDRTNRDTATTSIQEGSLRVKEQGRPILIFPQGTRVSIDTTSQQKRYKSGIYRIQDATQLPIIPMALNTGCFWPKGAWCKSPGTVIFEFLPPIEAGLDKDALMRRLEDTLEKNSQALVHEATQKRAPVGERQNWMAIILRTLLLACVLCAIAYGAVWYWVAETVREEHALFLKQEKDIAALGQLNVTRRYENASVSGFPWRINLDVTKESIAFPSGSLVIQNLHAHSALLSYPISVWSGPITLKSIDIDGSLDFNSFEGSISVNGTQGIIHEARLTADDYTLSLTGTITTAVQDEGPEIDLLITIDNEQNFLHKLKALKLLDKNSIMLMQGIFNSFKTNQQVSIPVRLQNGKVFAGPLLLGHFP